MANDNIDTDSEVEVKPAPETVAAPRIFVVIENRLAQLVSPSIYDQNKRPVEIRLAPRAVSEPIEEHKITPYTKSLAANGHVRIRSAQ